MSGTWTRTLFCIVFIDLVFIFAGLCQHQSYCEKSSTKSQSQGSAPVASSLQRIFASFSVCPSRTTSSTTCTSFQRSLTDSAHFCGNQQDQHGDLHGRSVLEMYPVQAQENQSSWTQALPWMWNGMASLLRPDLCPSIPNQHTIDLPLDSCSSISSSLEASAVGSSLMECPTCATKVIQCQERQIQKGQEEKQGQESWPAKAASQWSVPDATGASDASVLWCGIPSHDSSDELGATANSSSTSSTNGTSHRVRPSSAICYSDQPLRGEVQCNHAGHCQCRRCCSSRTTASGAHNWRINNSADGYHPGRGLRACWRSSKKDRAGHVGQISDALFLAQLPRRRSPEVEGVHRELQKPRIDAEWPYQHGQSGIQDPKTTLQQAQAILPGHGSRSRTIVRGGKHRECRSQGQQEGSRSFAPRNSHEHAEDLRESEDACRLYDCGRRAKKQEEKKWAIWCRRVSGAFWLARLVQPSWDANLGPRAWPGDKPWAETIVQKWTHSLWTEEEPVTEWQAAWDATLLSMETGSYLVSNENPATHSLPALHPEGHGLQPSSIRKYQRKGMEHRHVRFDEKVQIALGKEEDQCFSTFWTTSQKLLQWSCKPWTLYEPDPHHGPVDEPDLLKTSSRPRSRRCKHLKDLAFQDTDLHMTHLSGCIACGVCLFLRLRLTQRTACLTSPYKHGICTGQESHRTECHGSLPSINTMSFGESNSSKCGET